MEVTQHPIQWVPEVYSPLVKWLQPNADHTLNVWNVWSHSNLHMNGMQKDNFTLHYNEFSLQSNYVVHHHCLQYI